MFPLSIPNFPRPKKGKGRNTLAGFPLALPIFWWGSVGENLEDLEDWRTWAEVGRFLHRFILLWQGFPLALPALLKAEPPASASIPTHLQ